MAVSVSPPVGGSTRAQRGGGGTVIALTTRHPASDASAIPLRHLAALGDTSPFGGGGAPPLHSLAVEVNPAGVLAMWAAGLAAGLAVVSRWRVVGPGYTWLASGVTLLFGVPAAVAGAGPWAVVGCVLAGLCIAAVRSQAVVPLGAAAALVAAAAETSAGGLSGTRLLVTLPVGRSLNRFSKPV